MNSEKSLLSNSSLVQGLHALHSYWGWILALGVVLILLGIMSLGAPFAMTLTTVMLYGVLLAIGGTAEILSAYWARQWNGLFLVIFSGILHLVVGIFMIDRPVQTAAGFTLMLAVFLVVAGLLRIVVAVIQRFPQWGWVLVNGLVTLALGIMIWRDWPEASLWVIGTFVGVHLLFTGWSWVMLAFAARALPQITE